MSKRIPPYRLHKPTGLAVVSINGRDFYWGPHGTEESQAEYDRMIQEWLPNGRRLLGEKEDITINELLMHSLQWAESDYRKPDGNLSGKRNSLQSPFVGCVKGF